MRRLLILAATCLIVECAAGETRERGKLMDRIEAKVHLPDGARPLSSYARHYAFDKNGLVLAVYSPGYQAPDPSWKCEDLLENMSTREVPCVEIDSDRLMAGQRQWVKNANELPLISDGGCGDITVVYDPKRDVVSETSCNGIG